MFSELQPICRIWNQARKSIVQFRVRIMNLYKTSLKIKEKLVRNHNNL